MSIRAVVMDGPGRDLRTVELPEPVLAPGGALLRTTYGEVCGTDVHLADGKLAGVPYPIVPGHVSVGVVEKTHGELRDVDGVPFAEGDVAAFFDVHGSCGACYQCLVAKAGTRCPSRTVYGITLGLEGGPFGGWAEKIHLLPGTKLLRLPEGLDPATYIGGGCGLNTAYAAVSRANIALGDSVAVLGVGPVGQSVCAFAALAGAGEVLAIGAPDDRLAFSRRMGATNTCGLDGTADERAAWVRERTGGWGADVVIEAAGDPRAVRDALLMVRDSGTVVVAGQYTDNGDVAINPHELINKKHVNLLGSWGSEFRDFHRAIAVMGQHRARFPWHELAAESFDLEHAADALSAVRERRVLKATIRP